MQMPTFTTARLQLRPWSTQEAPALLALRRDEGFCQFSNFEPLDLAGAREELKMRLVASRPGFGYWAICDPDVVGVIQLKDLTLDCGRSLPEMGYRLRQDTWGRGYATEAALCLRDYACGALGVNPLHLFIDPANHRSQGVARRIGFTAGEPGRFKGFDVVIWSRCHS